MIDLVVRCPHCDEKNQIYISRENTRVWFLCWCGERFWVRAWRSVRYETGVEDDRGEN